MKKQNLKEKRRGVIMELVKVKDLKPHSRNIEFFDDITGDNWKLFLESIEQNGVITPLVITQDLIIVSGHQRAKACLELGIENILVRIKIYKEDDKRKLSLEDVILEELILTNLRQRGIGNTNPIKMGRCIMELERLNGIKNGGDRKSEGNFSVWSQQDLANSIGLNERTLRNYKQLAQTIPEIQDLIQDGKLSAEVGRKVFAKFSKEDQKKILDIYTPEKLTASKSSDIIEKVKEIEKIIEIYPDDYEESKNALSTLKKEYGDIQSKLKQQSILIDKLKKNNEDVEGAESKKSKLEKECFEIEKKKHKLESMYGDETNSIHKQSELDDLISKHKDLIMLVNARFTGFKPYHMTKDHFNNIIREYEKVLLKGLDMVSEWKNGIDILEAETIEECEMIE